MTMMIDKIISKYQGVAPKNVLHAVERAAARTGANFSFLMEKAAAESNFNTKAKSKSSSATGLFQFIESTWLKMIKEHGHKYGLGSLAEKIEMKGGRPCVDDCDTRNAILSLRKNPEIAALMAGELTENNEQYLKAHTKGDVGETELYLAHFLGAGGAAKFLNGRAYDGDRPAAALFVREARANKSIFFDRATGEARSLNEIYDLFANKFNDSGSSLRAAPSAPARAPAVSAFSPMDIAQALPSYSIKDIIWDDEAKPEEKSGFTRNAKFSTENFLLLARARNA